MSQQKLCFCVNSLHCADPSFDTNDKLAGNSDLHPQVAHSILMSGVSHYQMTDED